MARPESTHACQGNRFAITSIAIAVGGVAAYLGIGGVGTVWTIVVRDNSFGEVVFGVLFASILLLMSFWCAALSVRAFQTASPRVASGLAAVVGVSSWFAVGICLNRADVTIGGLRSSTWDNIFNLVAIAVATGTFVFARWFMSPSHATDWGIPGLCIGALCLFFWLAGSDVLLDLAPKEPGYEHVPRLPWSLVGLILPIVGAIGLGRVLSRYRLHQDDASSAPRAIGPTT